MILFIELIVTIVLLSAISSALVVLHWRAEPILSSALLLSVVLLVVILTMVGHSKLQGVAQMAPEMPVRCSTAQRGELQKPLDTRSLSLIPSPQKEAHHFAVLVGNALVRPGADSGTGRRAPVLKITIRNENSDGRPYEY